VFVPGKPFQPSPMFVNKAGTYPSEPSLWRSSRGQASDLTYKH